jgi:hypothetical protein
MNRTRLNPPLFNLTVLLLVLLAVPIAGRAQFTYVTNADNSLTLTACTGTGPVSIPASATGHPVSAVGASAFFNDTGLTSVTVPSSVTSIGSGAFSGCSGLTNAVLTDSITNLGATAFSGCLSLPGLTLPAGLTELSFGTFENCYALTNLVFPASLNSIDSSALFYCTSLKRLTVPSGVTNIGASAFAGCYGLTNVVLAASVTNWGGGVFSGCSSLPGLTLPAGLTEIPNGAFQNCTALTNLVFPAGLKDIEAYAFVNCASLTSLTLPDAVTNLGQQACLDCPSLTNVTVGTGLTTLGAEAFTECGSLLNFTVSGTNPDFSSSGGVLFNKTQTALLQYPLGLVGDYTIPDGVTSVADQAFWGSANLTSVSLPASVVSLGYLALDGCDAMTEIDVASTNPAFTNLDGVLFDKTMSTLVQFPGGWNGAYTVPAGVINVGDFSFYGCPYVTSVTLAASVSTIGQDAFAGDYSLTNVMMNNGLTSIGSSAFFNTGGAGLTSVTIPNSVTNVGDDAFNSCYTLTNVLIGSGVMNLGAYAFWDCNNLQTALFEGNPPLVDGQPGQDDTTVFSSDSAPEVVNVSYLPGSSGWGFFGGQNTTEYTNPATDFQTSVNGDGTLTITAFLGTESILSIPGSIGGQTVSGIADQAFANQTNLVYAGIPASVTTIGFEPFVGCTNLQAFGVDAASLSFASAGGVLFDVYLNTLLAFPDGVTGSYTLPRIGYVGDGAFAGCSLTNVIFPATIAGVGQSAFEKSPYLTQAQFRGNAPTVDGNYGNMDTTVFQDDQSGTVYYLTGAAGWGSTFGGWNTQTTNTPATDFTYVTNSGSITITGCLVQEDNVAFPDTITGHPVTVIGDNALANQTNLLTAGLSDNVVALGTNSFANDPLLASVTLDSNLASIGATAFANCTSLAGINFDDGLTSIGDQAFSNCPSLTSASLDSSLTNLGVSAFSDCSGLASVTIPASLASIGTDAFQGCYSLASFSVATGNPSYSSAGGVLFNSAETTLLVYPPGLAGNYTIPSGVTNVATNAFYECWELASVSIPASVTSGLDGGAFYGCYPTNFTVASGNTHYASSGGVLFNQPLTRLIQYPAGLAGTYTVPGGVTDIGAGAFQDCYYLTAVTLDTSLTNIEADAFSTCYQLRLVTIPANVTGIGDSAFEFCGNLGSVSLGNSVTGLGDSAFYGCQNLTNLVLDSGLVSIGDAAFQGCYLLTNTLAIPNSVVVIGDGAFAGCSSLTGLTLGSSVASIGQDAFESCFRLTNTLTIPASVTNLAAWAFNGCYGLTNVTISAALGSIGYEAFSQCSSLAGVEFPATLTNLGSYSFAYCPKLAGVALPAGLTTVGAGTFYDSGLINVTLPDSVTSLGDFAFGWCSALTNAVIGVGVTNVGSWAFEGAGLTNVYFRGNAPLIDGAMGNAGNVVFSGSGVVYYVPGTTGWQASFGGWPTAAWYLPQPQILGAGAGLTADRSAYQFGIASGTGSQVIIEASTNLVNWTSLTTNTLVNGTNLFDDGNWAAYPQRFYRVRLP